MMTATAVPQPPAAEPLDEGVRPRRWTREEYHRAADLGLFRPGERLELLDGEILEHMSPQNPPHANAMLRVSRVLELVFGPGYHVRHRLPLVLDDGSEPEPDVAVLIGHRDDYAAESPRAHHARLLVEVSDTTLRLDRGRKRPAYARAGIPEYWIVNLRQRQLEVYRDPEGRRYRSETVYRTNELVSPLGAPDAQIRVTDLLPPALTQA